MTDGERQHSIAASNSWSKTVAKGNDGNFLQHSVELAAANRLAVENPGALHVAITHGMAPFEPFEPKLSDKAAGLSRCRLKAALALAAGPPQEGEPSIVTAYRRTRASRCYPNSATLLRTLGMELAGGISETSALKHKQLAADWVGSPVRTVHASWRCQVQPGGVLACPRTLDTPWLFTMDPKTYRRDQPFCDDANLYRHDIERLYEPLQRYVDSEQPGMVALFVYGVQKQRSCQFWDFVEALSSRTQMFFQTYQIALMGSIKNLAALLYSSIDIPDEFLQDAVEEIEDFALLAAMEDAEEGYSSLETISQILRGQDESSNTKEL